MNLDDFAKLYTTVSIQAQIAFGLALIAFLLTYIAFIKKPTNKKTK